MIGISYLLNHSEESVNECNDDKVAKEEESAVNSSKNSIMLMESKSDSSTDGSSRSSINSNSSTAKTTPVCSSNDFPSTVTTKIPKCKVNKKFLINKKFVKIAIRRKSISRKDSNIEHHLSSKLHVKSLEAGLRVKLTLAPSITSLYNSLIPHTNKKKVLPIFEPDANGTENLSHMNDVKNKLISKSVQLIDNNLVNLSGFSNKVLKTFSLNKKTSNPSHNSDKEEENPLPTFNSLHTAAHSVFGINEFTLVRVTRSTTDDLDGSILLKLETSKPGDYKLIDDDEFFDEMYYSIGRSGDIPNNLFIKKVVARPRYKSDMKIYLIPRNLDCSLYTDERMFERDLINGIIDLDSPLEKSIYVAFPYDDIVNDFRHLVKLSENCASSNESNLNCMTASPPVLIPSNSFIDKPLPFHYGMQQSPVMPLNPTFQQSSPVKQQPLSYTAPPYLSSALTSPAKKNSKTRQTSISPTSEVRNVYDKPDIHVSNSAINPKPPPNLLSVPYPVQNQPSQPSSLVPTLLPSPLSYPLNPPSVYHTLSTVNYCFTVKDKPFIKKE